MQLNIYNNTSGCDTWKLWPSMYLFICVAVTVLDSEEVPEPAKRLCESPVHTPVMELPTSLPGMEEPTYSWKDMTESWVSPAGEPLPSTSLESESLPFFSSADFPEPYITPADEMDGYDFSWKCWNPRFHQQARCCPGAHGQMLLSPGRHGKTRRRPQPVWLIWLSPPHHQQVWLSPPPHQGHSLQSLHLCVTCMTCWKWVVTGRTPHLCKKTRWSWPACWVTIERLHPLNTDIHTSPVWLKNKTKLQINLITMINFDKWLFKAAWDNIKCRYISKQMYRDSINMSRGIVLSNQQTFSRERKSNHTDTSQQSYAKVHSRWLTNTAYLL